MKDIMVWAALAFGILSLVLFVADHNTSEALHWSRIETKFYRDIIDGCISGMDNIGFADGRGSFHLACNREPPAAPHPSVKFDHYDPVIDPQ